MIFIFIKNWKDCDISCKECTGPLPQDCKEGECTGNHFYENNKGCICKPWQKDIINGIRSRYCESNAI